MAVRAAATRSAADRSLGALRLSLGRWSTLEDVQRAADLLAEAYAAAMAMNVPATEHM